VKTFITILSAVLFVAPALAAPMSEDDCLTFVRTAPTADGGTTVVRDIRCPGGLRIEEVNSGGDSGGDSGASVSGAFVVGVKVVVAARRSLAAVRTR
jgi:hypothetical protein